MNEIERTEARRARARSAEYGKAAITFLRRIEQDPTSAANEHRELSAVALAIGAFREATTAVGLENGEVRFFG